MYTFMQDTYIHEYIRAYEHKYTRAYIHEYIYT